MINFKQLAQLVLFLFLLTYTAWGQNEYEKQRIDSIVSENEKIAFVQKSYFGDSLEATYFINPKTESVMKIRVRIVHNSRTKWVYKYYLDSNQRPMIVSADRIDGKAFRLAICYIKDDKVIYKKETNVKLDSPEKQLQSVKYLLDRMPE